MENYHPVQDTGIELHCGPGMTLTFALTHSLTLSAVLFWLDVLVHR